jgi:hypothetical protein
MLPVAQPQPGCVVLRKSGLPWLRHPAKLNSHPRWGGCMVLQIGRPEGPGKRYLFLRYRPLVAWQVEVLDRRVKRELDELAADIRTGPS